MSEAKADTALPAATNFSRSAAVAEPKHSARSEASWILSISALTAAVFFANNVLLFTEFNVWALVAYAADFVKAGSSEKYIIRTINTPNGLFNLLHFYLKDVLFFMNSYVLYKSILFACVVSNVFILVRLSRYKSAYIILLPVVFGYVLVGGMTNYYISLTLFLAALLLYETGRDSPLKTFTIAILAYHAHFMGFVCLMLLVLYKEGVRNAILCSIIPLILFVSYKQQYKDMYDIGFSYGLDRHILSIRRVFLPATADYNSNIYILVLSGALNLIFCAAVTYLLFAGYLVPRDRQGYLVALGLLAIYFLVPATIAGSGYNIHERLLIPFFAMLVHVSKEKNIPIRPVIAYTALLLVNIEACHYFFDAQSPDYRNALINKVPMAQAAAGAADMINGKHVDLITNSEFFTTGFVGLKP